MGPLIGCRRITAPSVEWSAVPTTGQQLELESCKAFAFSTRPHRIDRRDVRPKLHKTRDCATTPIDPLRQQRPTSQQLPNSSGASPPSCRASLSSRQLRVRHSLSLPSALLTASPGKRIALPTRVEPKVFFANERTFLSWLNFTVILGGLAIGLLNFGDKVGKISAGLFTLVAMMAMVYALFTFHWRAKSIRMRGQGGFDDRLGPTILTLALFAAVVVNFVLRVTMGNEKKH